MQIDLLVEPDSAGWYDDKDGNFIKYLGSESSGEWPKGSKYLNFIDTRVVHSIHQVGDGAKSRWPVRLCKWLLKKMPRSWFRDYELVFTGNCRGDGGYPVINYLVNKGWRYSRASAVTSQLCGRCVNICLDNVNGVNPAAQRNFDKISTHCGTCKVIDPDYNIKYRIWCCYRTLKMGGNLKKAYYEYNCNSSDDYWEKKLRNA